MVEAWQHQVRQETLDDDLNRLGLSAPPKIRSSDVTLSLCSVEEVTPFIERYEWLGKMSNYPTHAARLDWKGEIISAIVFDMPIAFSKMLGDKTRKMERLISRGANVSYAPKWAASYIISNSIKLMANSTRYRLFVAYADPDAGELGTVYQACNFYYLGQKFGTRVQYLYNGRWVSDRTFRSRSAYKRYAVDLDISWKDDWNTRDRIHWDRIPDDIEEALRQRSKDTMNSLEKRNPPLKHKYVQVVGRGTLETRFLRREFEKRNKTYPYPKERGI